MKTTETITGLMVNFKQSRTKGRLLLALIIPVFMLLAGMTQAQTINVSSPNQTACPGATLTFPINVTNFSNVADVSFTLVFNPAVVTPASTYITNIHPSFVGFVLYNALTDYIRFAWFSLTPVNIGTGKLFDLHFTYIGGNGSFTFPGGEANNFGTPAGTPIPTTYNTFTVQQKGSVTTQPVNQSVNEGDPTSFTITAVDPLGYAWQVNTGSGWTPLTNTAPYSGVNTNTLNISTTTLSMNNYQYRCVVTGACTPPTTNSNPATLTILSGCQDATANAGPDGNLCSNVASYALAGSATNFTSVQWTTTGGDGSFTNATSLAATYQPGPNDILNGSVTLTLTAYAAAPCNNGTDNITITIIPPPTCDAGSNESTCEGLPFSLSSSAVPPSKNIFSGNVSWSHNGTGTLSGATTLTPTYNPGSGETGNVILTMTVQGIAPCASVQDFMTLTIVPGPVVDAGSNENICAGQPFFFGNATTPPSANAHVTGVDWTHFGTGTLTNETTLTPTYTPGAGETGSIMFILTGSATPPCTDVFDFVTLTIAAAPSATLTGGGTICAGNSSSLSVAFTGSGPWTFVYSAGGVNQTPITTSSNPHVISVSPAATTNYALVSVQSPACAGTVSGTATVTVNPLPVVVASANPTSICAGGSSLVSATGATTYTWDQGLGAGQTHPVTPAATTTYTVTGTLNGCTATDDITVTVNARPTVTAGATDLEICSGESTNLTASGAASYSWSHGANGSPVSVSPSVTTTYTVTGTAANSCTNTAQVTITVNALPNIQAIATDYDICVGESTSLTASGGSNYAWSNGNSGASINVSPAVTTTYTVTGTDANGCSNTADVTITVNDLPLVDISATDLEICVGESTDLYASGASTYIWSTTETGLMITVAPTTTTTYTVTGTDGNGCINTASIQITVNPLPTVAIIPTASQVCQGVSTDLEVMGMASVEWSTSEITAIITVTPSVTTTYTVTATDNNGCSNTASILILVDEVPVMAINATDQDVCLGSSTDLTVSGANSYLWSTGSTNATITVSPAITTTYTVTGTGLNGCTAEQSIVIDVLDVPAADAGADQSIFMNGTAILNGTAIGGSGSYAYLWQPAALLSDPSTASPTTVSLTATQVFTLVVTDMLTGCESDPDQVTITVTGLNLAVTVDAMPTSVCIGDQVELNATATGGSGTYTYTWTSIPAGFTGSASLVFDSPLVTTTYIVTVDDGVKTVVQDSITVVVNPLPVVTASANPVEICAGEDAVLTAGGAVNYAWSNGSNGSPITVNPTATTVYTVTGTDNNGCTQTAEVQVVVNSLPIVDITATETDICVGESTDLTASGAQSYIWSTGATTAMIQVSPAVTTTYTVTGTDINGCSQTDAITINVHPLPTYQITTTSNVLCVGESRILEAVGAGTFEWSTLETGSTITVSPAVTTTYSITGTDINGCVNTAEITLTVNDLPVVDISASDNIMCIGETVTLLASGAVNYVWSTMETTAGISVSPAATSTYTVTGTDNNGCSNTASITITVNDLPLVGVSATDTEICVGASTDLTATGALTYAWSSAQTGSMITVSPLVTTDYTVTGTDVNGCENTASIQIVVNALPVVGAATSTPSICAGESADLMASNAATYVWSTGGTSAMITVTPAVTSTYTVTGTDANGCSNTASVTVTVNDLPVANAGVAQFIPYNTSTTLSGSATGGSGNYSYAWTPASELVNANIQNPVTLDLLTTTLFTLVVTDNVSGCVSAPVTVLINVSGAPLAVAVSATPQQICQGSPTQLLALATGGSGSYTYTWTSNPAGFTANVHNPVLNPTVTTTYTVNVDDGAKTIVSGSVTVTVLEPAQADAGPDGFICQGTSYGVTGASVMNNNGFTWQHDGAGVLLGGNTLTPTYVPTMAETGVVTLTLTAHGNAPCPDETSTATITIYGVPVFSVHPANIAVIEGTGASFTVTATPVTAYTWQVSDNNGASWTSLTNNATYSGVSTNTLTISSTDLLMDGLKYRCVAENNICSNSSNTATLNVSPSGSTIQTTAGSVVGCVGDTLIVPVSVQNLFNVASMSLSLQYNPAVLTYIGSQNPNALLTAQAGMIVNASPSSVFLSWFSLNPVNVGSDIIIEYLFVYNGGTSNLTWDLVTSGNCEYTDINSNVLTALFYDGTAGPASFAPVVTTQPMDANILDGGNASFSVSASGADAYQWQVSTNGGATWTNVVDNALYSGSQTATLNLTQATLLHNFYRFKCILTENICGLSTTTDIAELNVAPNGPVVTTVGSAIECPGETLIIPVTVSNMSTVSSISLNLNYNPAVLSFNGIQNLNSVLSGSAPIVNAAPGSLFFSWFSVTPASLASGTLFDISFDYAGGNTALTWDVVTQGNCEYTDFNALLLPAIFNDGQVNQLSLPPVVTLQPVTTTVPDGSSAVFTANGTGVDTWQWQISTNGGGSWTDISNNAIYSGATTASLTVVTDLSMNFHQFRAILTENVCDLTTTTDAAVLNVSPLGPINVTAGTGSGCPGDQIIIPVTAQNLPGVSSISLTLNYNASVLNYSSIQNIHPQLGGALPIVNAGPGSLFFSWFSIVPAYLSNGTLFEIVFNYTGGSTALTWDVATPGNCEFGDFNAIVLPATFSNGQVDPSTIAPIITVQPSNITVPTLSSGNFSVTASGADAYQWQISTNNGLSFVNINDGLLYAGTTTANLQVIAVNLGMDGQMFRCILTENGCGLTTTSAAAILNVTPITASTGIGSALACPGNQVVIAVLVQDLYDVATMSLTLNFDPAVLTFVGSQNVNSSLAAALPIINAGAGSVFMSWFSLTPANVGTGTLVEYIFTYHGGATNLTWDIATPGNTEYGDINTNLIPSTFTNGSVGFAGIAPTITLQPANALTYNGFTASFTVAATNATAYQWQVSTNGGLSYTDVINNAMYAGATTATLNLTGVTTAMDGYYYRAVVTGTCGLTTNSQAALLEVMAQPPIITTATTVADCEGTIVVPIMVEEFNNVAVISLGLQYDKNLLTYTGYQNVHPALSGAFFLINAPTTGNTVFVSWFSFAPANIGNGKLMDLVFTSNGSGTGNLTWDPTPGTCQYQNAGGNLLLGTFNNGTVTVHPNPVPVVTGTSQVCAGATAIAYQVPAAAGHSYVWTVTGGSIASGQGTNQITVNWPVAGSGSVSVTETVVATGCFGTSAAFAVTINPLPAPAISGDNSVCEFDAGEVYSTTDIAGNTYAWTITGGTIVSGANTAAVTVDWGAAGAGTLSVTETISATGCINTATFNVTINPLPAPVISGDYSVCEFVAGEVYSTTNIAGNTYAWTITGGTIVSGANTAAVTVDWGAAGAGTLEVIETVTATGCVNTASYNVTINPLPAPAISGDNSICEFDAGEVYSTTNIAGNTYTWTITGGTIVSGANTAAVTVDWGAAGAGTLEVTETVTATGCVNTASYNVTINPLPAPAISGDNSVCEFDAGEVYNTTNIAGNTYAWTITGGTIVSGANTAAVTVDWGAAGAGTLEVTETVTATGCVNTASYYVTINPLPAPAISGDNSICEFVAGEVYSTANIAGNTYAWTITGGTIVSGANTAAVTVDWGAAGAGTLEVTETVTATGCVNTASYNVTINPLPAPAISGDNSVCEFVAGEVYSTTNIAGNTYAWTITGGTIVSGANTAAVTVDWGAAGAGTLEVTETVTATGCVNTASYNVTINPLPAPAISGDNSVCEFDAGEVYSTANIAGNTYAWTITGGTIVSGANTAAVTVDWGAAGAGTLEVTETVTATGCVNTAAYNVTINPLPAPAISGDNSVCEFVAGEVYSTTNIAGNTYAWTISGGTIVSGANTAAVTVDWGVAGAGTLEVTETVTATGCVNTASYIVTINPLPAPAISGDNSVCEFDAGEVYSTTDIAGNTYAWTITGGTIISGASTAAVTVDWGAAGAGTLEVTETVTATGCVNTASYNVTINPLPAPAITGDNSVCEFVAGEVYSTTNIAGNTYAWTITGGTIVSGANTAAVTVDWGAAGAGTLEVTETVTATGCVNTASYNVTINPLPAPAISGDNSVCEFVAGEVYSTTNIAGNTYAWTITGGTIVSGANTAAVTVDWGAAGAGTLEVTETVTATGCVNTASYNVTINPLPAPAISGDNSVCTMVTGEIYSTTNIAGNTYAWTITGGTIVSGANTASVTVNWGAAGSGSLTVTETVTATGCINSITYNVTINPLPAPAISGLGTVCTNYQNAAYSTASVAGHTYSWTVTGGTITGGQGTATITVDWGSVSPGVVSVIQTITATGCAATATYNVTINPLPAPVIAGPTAVCANETAVAYSTASTPGSTYTWTVTGGTIGGGQGTHQVMIDWGAAGAGTLDLIETTANNCSASAATFNVNIQALPAVFNVTGGGSFCHNLSGVEVGLGGSANGVNYQLLLNGNPVGTAVAGTGAALSFGLQTVGGTYTAKAIDAVSGCESMMTGSATVIVIPGPSITTQPAHVAVDEGTDAVFSVVAANATGYQWQMSLNNGTSWNNLGNGPEFTGVFTSSLTVHNTDLSMTGRLFRVIVSGTCLPNVTSNAAMLTVNPVITTTIGTVSTCPGSFIVPIQVEHFFNVASISLTLNIDTAVLTFNGAQNMNAALTGGFTTINLLGDQVKFSWFSLAPASIGDGLLMNLSFTANAGFSALVWDDLVSGNCEYNQLTGASITSIFVDGSATIYPFPVVKNVTGGGSFCSGGAGVAVGLDGSESGVNYTLYLDGIATTNVVAGTGSAISFGLQTIPGTYTVHAAGAVSQCPEWMSGQAIVTVNPLPVGFNVTGGGTLCAGQAGYAVGIDGSETGVNYELYLNGVATGNIVAGTGSAIGFGTLTTAGTYTVMATNATTACAMLMNGSAQIIVNPLPLVFNVNGGGSFCDNGSGVVVGLDGSEIGINYTLYLNGVATSVVVGGTGNAISFGLQNVTGTYTVVAENATTACMNNMAGSAIINLYPNPVAYAVTGGGVRCEDEPGFDIGLAMSDAGINYILYLDGVATSNVVAGTGAAISFGTLTMAGTYTVKGMDAVTSCEAWMTGQAVIVVNPLPVVFNVLGGGGYCDGGPGSEITLSGSELGVHYTLYHNGVATSVVVAGNGSAISFGNQVLAGTYTVGAENTTTGCIRMMNGSTDVMIYPLPMAQAGGFSIICEGETANLVATVSGGTTPYTYLWSPAAGLNDPSLLNPVASPVITTNYTLLVTDDNGCTSSDDYLVVVNPAPVVDAGLDKTILAGTATYLNASVTGGTAPYVYNWTPVVSLNNPAILTPIATPTVTTVYTLEVTDAQGCMAMDQVTVTVTALPAGHNINGIVTYDNGINTLLDNVSVYLNDGVAVQDTTMTDPLGQYIFPGLNNGTYQISATTLKPWGGVNSLDALKIAHHFQGISILNGLRLGAADVDGNGVVNANDALLTMQRSAGYTNSFPIGKDWLFEQTSVTLAGGDVINNFMGICYGDVNGSQFTGVKSSGISQLPVSGSLRVVPGATFRLPVNVSQAIEVGALSLTLSLPQSIFQVHGVEVANGQGVLVHRLDGNTIRIEWYSLNGQKFQPGDAMIYLVLSLQNNISMTDDLNIGISLSSQAGDKDGQPIAMPGLSVPKLSWGNVNEGVALGNNYPNPFNDYTEITFTLPSSSHIRLSVLNMLGEEVLVGAEGMTESGTHTIRVEAGSLAPGTYFYRLVAQGDNLKFSQTKKMIITR